MAASIPAAPPLDPSIYNLNEEELAFFKAQTGIQDEAELRVHILNIQAAAYAIYPYPCIRRLAFTSLKISKHPAYQDILTLGKERPNAILLDLGCCFGNDPRKAIADGFPRENVIASDLRAEFWDLGHKLFKTTQETFIVPFLAGDIFDPTFLSPTTSPAPSSAAAPAPPLLARLTSLTPLQHHISIIHVGAFFHLFSETKQRELAHLLATLLSPLPGSMIFGSHMAVPDTEENKFGSSPGAEHRDLGFTHSPTSWKELWSGKDGIFKPEEVICRVKTVELERKAETQAMGHQGSYPFHLLMWSVTRARGSVEE